MFIFNDKISKLTSIILLNSQNASEFLLLLLPFIWMTFFSKYVKLIFDIIIAAIIIGINFTIIIVLVVQIIIIIITFKLNNKNYYINDKMKSKFQQQQQMIKTNLYFFLMT